MGSYVWKQSYCKDCWRPGRLKSIGEWFKSKWNISGYYKSMFEQESTFKDHGWKSLTVIRVLVIF